MRKSLQDSNFSRAIVLGSEIGFLISLPLISFLLLGIFLDKKFNTFPLFLISSVILSLIVTIFNIYHLILPFLEKRPKIK